METSNGQAYSSFEPEEHDESDGFIPRVRIDGWIRLIRWDRKERLLMVRTVRVFEKVMAEQLYPVPPNGKPRYLDMFPSGDIEPMSEDEAHAWLQRRGLPVPGESTTAVEAPS